MTTDKYGLEDIIKRSYNEYKEYLKRAGIEIKGIRLRILESSNLLQELYDMIKTYDINKLKQELNTIDKSLLEKISNYDDIYVIKKGNLREFYIGEIYLLRQIYNTDDINELNKKILKYVVHLIKNENAPAIGIPKTKEIYIIKDRLEKGIDEILNRLGPININGPSIIRLGSPLFGIVSAPLYTDGKNIKEDIAKVVAGNVIIHEVVHYFVEREELADWEFLASVLEYIMYIDMYNLLKYPKTYEIIKENIITCKKYTENLNTLAGYLIATGNFLESLPEEYVNVFRRAPYNLGECYASIIIDRNKNKKSPCLNIKDIIEEVKNLSILDALIKISDY
jgi:hypothetical protein